MTQPAAVPGQVAGRPAGGGSRAGGGGTVAALPRPPHGHWAAPAGAGCDGYARSPALKQAFRLFKASCLVIVSLHLGLPGSAVKCREQGVPSQQGRKLMLADQALLILCTLPCCGQQSIRLLRLSNQAMRALLQTATSSTSAPAGLAIGGLPALKAAVSFPALDAATCNAAPESRHRHCWRSGAGGGDSNGNGAAAFDRSGCGGGQEQGGSS